MAEHWSNRNEEPTEGAPPRLIHVSVEALNSLKGLLVIDSLPYIHPQYETLCCGAPVMPGPTEWISRGSAGAWKAGRLTELPTCPSCSVAWDEALESVSAQPEVST